MKTQSRNSSHQLKRMRDAAAAASRRQALQDQQSQDGGGAQRQPQSEQDERNDQEADTSAGSRDALSPRRSSGALTAAGRSQDPLTSVLQLSREVDRLFDIALDYSFDSLFARMPARSSMLNGVKSLWSPRIDMREQGDSLIVRADLPGIKRDEVQIEATPEGLAISGEGSRERHEEQDGYRLSERRRGNFYRLVPLPDGAQADNAKATMRDGVLEITIPLAQKPRGKLINIDS